jgi:hypothetical protein
MERTRQREDNTFIMHNVSHAAPSAIPRAVIVA